MGERVEAGQELEGEFFVVAVAGGIAEAAHVRAAAVVFDIDRDEVPPKAAVLTWGDSHGVRRAARFVLC